MAVEHWINTSLTPIDGTPGTPTDVHTVYSEPYHLPKGIVVIERPKE